MSPVVDNPAVREPLLDWNGAPIPVERLIPQDHQARRVGPMGAHVQCKTCLTICMPDYELRGWFGPDPDDEVHAYPFDPDDPDWAEEDPPERVNDAPERPETAEPGGVAPMSTGRGPAATRASLGLDLYPKRGASAPSRTPEARHEEYLRRKRRQAIAAKAAEA